MTWISSALERRCYWDLESSCAVRVCWGQSYCVVFNEGVEWTRVGVGFALKVLRPIAEVVGSRHFSCCLTPCKIAMQCFMPCHISSRFASSWACHEKIQPNHDVFALCCVAVRRVIPYPRFNLAFRCVALCRVASLAYGNVSFRTTMQNTTMLPRISSEWHQDCARILGDEEVELITPLWAHTRLDVVWLRFRTCRSNSFHLQPKPSQSLPPVWGTTFTIGSARAGKRFFGLMEKLAMMLRLKLVRKLPSSTGKTSKSVQSPTWIFHQTHAAPNQYLPRRRKVE